MFSTLGHGMDCSAGMAGPRLCIVKQPEPFYRFRYASEMNQVNNTFFGPLKGAGAEHPIIQLINYEEDDAVLIRVSLRTVDDQPHVHQIVYKQAGSDNWTIDNAVDISVTSQHDFKLILKNMIIVRTLEKDWIRAEVQRLMNSNSNVVTEQKDLETQAKAHWQSLKLSQVKLCFQALKRFTEQEICGTLSSDVISNKGDSTVGELKITRMSAYCARKDDELIFLVSKIAKRSNVKIRFFDPIDPTWEHYIEKFESHHQVALIFTVPELKEGQLQVQLERTCIDDSKIRSEPRDIKYNPKIFGKRKNSSHSVNSDYGQRVRRTIGQSSSEEGIQIQRGELPATSSCPNVSWEDQGAHHTSGGQGNSGLHEMQTDPGSELEGYLINVDCGMQAIQINAKNELTDPLLQDLDWEELFKGLTPLGPGVIYEADYSNKSKKKDCTSTSNVTGKDYVYMDGAQHNQPLASIPSHQILTSLYQATGDAKTLKKLTKDMKTMETVDQQKLINYINSEELTTLIIAVEENYAECVDILCSAGANVNFVDAEENTAFHIAVKKNHKKCLEMLLKVPDRKLDIKDAKGETALHLAVLLNNMECVKMLIKAGANINEKNGTGGLTPLHLAVHHGYTHLVELLLTLENVNVHEVNYADKSAADLVKPYQDEMIVLFKRLQNIDVPIEEDEVDKYEDE